jgi:hypothetical protein
MRIHARTLAARSAMVALLATLTLLACEGTDQAAEGRRTMRLRPKEPSFSLMTFSHFHRFNEMDSFGSPE